MSRQEAVDQYDQALKSGRKMYRDCLLRGQYPYPQVLDEIFDESMAAGRVELGIIDIPAEQIAGTKTRGRQPAFAPNFMPLLPHNTEFAQKWISLCEASLSDEGIREPVRCIEYLGRFYVQEGNKRVSVLKSFGSPVLPASVLRIIPAWSEETQIRVYYEFMDYYRLSRLYIPVFGVPGSYRKLQAALGFDAGHEWTEEERRSFSAAYYAFSSALKKRKDGMGQETVGDALLKFLQVFSFSELKDMTQEELAKSIAGIWPEVEVQAKPEPIDISTENAGASRSVLSRLVGIIVLPAHLNVAFVNECPPERSPWVMAHDQGRRYLTETLAGKVSTSVYNVTEGTDAYDLMEAAVADGAQVIFATTANLIASCRKAAVRHPNVRILNCSVSMPFPEVRTYYARIYEGKFISGAVAGAMTKTDRVGYIASSPIYGMPAGINAFALGARLTNPDVRVKLRWSSVSEDPIAELKGLGVDMISNRDIPSPEQSQHEWGLCRVDDDGGLVPIGSPYWNWGEMYVRIVQNILDGGWDELSYKNSGRAVNYWWGMSSGAVDIRLSHNIPDGMAGLVEILRHGICSGTILPFHRKIRSQDGRVINDGSRWLSAEEILHMDWLCDCVDGEIPGFDELLPMAQSLVRLLGVYRDWIIPDKGGVQV